MNSRTAVPVVPSGRRARALGRHPYRLIGIPSGWSLSAPSAEKRPARRPHSRTGPLFASVRAARSAGPSRIVPIGRIMSMGSSPRAHPGRGHAVQAHSGRTRSGQACSGQALWRPRSPRTPQTTHRAPITGDPRAPSGDAHRTPLFGCFAVIVVRACSAHGGVPAAKPPGRTALDRPPVRSPRQCR